MAETQTDMVIIPKIRNVQKQENTKPRRKNVKSLLWHKHKQKRSLDPRILQRPKNDHEKSKGQIPGPTTSIEAQNNRADGPKHEKRTNAIKC